MFLVRIIASPSSDIRTVSPIAITDLCGFLLTSLIVILMWKTMFGFTRFWLVSLIASKSSFTL